MESRDVTATPAARPAREVLAEIAGMSATVVVLMAMGSLVPGGQHEFEQAWKWDKEAGVELLAQVGWAFGAYVTVLLGFYAIVIGGQLIGDPAAAARIRRVLGLVAVLIAVSVSPVVVLIVVACVQSPVHLGSLWVVLPTAAILWFLAVQLGGFVIAEPEVRRAEANSARFAAAKKLRSMRMRSRRPLWLVWTLTAAVGAFICVFVTYFGERWAADWIQLWALYAVVVLMLSGANTLARYTANTSEDRTSRALAWLFPALLSFGIVAVVVDLVVFTSPPVIRGGIGLATAVILTEFTTFVPSRWGRFVRDWSVHGVSTTLAARTEARRYRRASMELRAMRATADRPTFRQRLRAVAAAMTTAAKP